MYLRVHTKKKKEEEVIMKVTFTSKDPNALQFDNTDLHIEGNTVDEIISAVIDRYVYYLSPEHINESDIADWDDPEEGKRFNETVLFILNYGLYTATKISDDEYTVYVPVFEYFENPSK